MLRPLFAFLTLCLAAFLLAPTVASVHQKVDELSVDRELPWKLWKWDELPEPPNPFGCGKEERQLYSEVTRWPARIQKDQVFTVGGVVQSEEDGRLGVGRIWVDLYLNATKEEEGVHLGEVESSTDGSFTLTTSVPFDVPASRYHLVAHAKEARIDCKRYAAHWSDPEVDVFANTTIKWSDSGRLVVGRNATLGGHLVDDVEAPVRNATVNVTFLGKTTPIQTDSSGAFSFPFRPASPGEVRLVAEYKGSRHYNATRGNTTYDVLEEDVELDAEPAFVRGSPTTLSGRVYVAEGVAKPEVLLTFQGVKVVTCEGCAPTDRVNVTVAPDGSFATTLTVPSSEKAGQHKLTISGGGLRKPYAYNATVEIAARLELDAKSAGLFSKDYAGKVVLTDETGAPLQGEVAVTTADGESRNRTDASGVLAFSGSVAECGQFPVRASYSGGDHIRAAEASQTVTACGFLAFIPPWLLATPWWVWPLALLALLAGAYALHAWRQNYATVIVGGPALTLSFTEPRDVAAGYAGIGEAVVATAFLEEPLPDGHSLRMGTYRSTHEVPIDSELRAHLRILPEKLGELPVRAEIVDPKGRVVTRRTLTLHVVKYAEEIERRYLSLQRETGAAASATPREFERWLHERAPGIDPHMARRLVQVFEEADYSPRVAGRAEFAAYLAAEGNVKEVKADALA